MWSALVLAAAVLIAAVVVALLALKRAVAPKWSPPYPGFPNGDSKKVFE